MKAQCNDCGVIGNIDTKALSQEVCWKCGKQGCLSRCVEPKINKESSYIKYTEPAVVMYEKDTIGNGYIWHKSANLDIGKHVRDILADKRAQGFGILPDKTFLHREVVAADMRAELMRGFVVDTIVHIHYVFEHDKNKLHFVLCLSSNIANCIKELESRLSHIGKVLVVCAYTDDGRILVKSGVFTGIVADLPRYGRIKHTKTDPSDYTKEKIVADVEAAGKAIEDYHKSNEVRA